MSQAQKGVMKWYKGCTFSTTRVCFLIFIKNKVFERVNEYHFLPWYKGKVRVHLDKLQTMQLVCHGNDRNGVAKQSSVENKLIQKSRNVIYNIFALMLLEDYLR